MNTSEALSLIKQNIEETIRRVGEHLKEQDSKRRMCANPQCLYCERIGMAKLTFAKTKPLLQNLVASLIMDSCPRLIIDRHVRPAYGNYQAWILPNGHYVNVWRIGGHSIFHSDCSGSDIDRMIKIHAQRIPRIIIYDVEKPPTVEQMATLRDVYADAIFNSYTETYQLELSLSYDTHHPNPRTLKETPF